MKIRIRLVDHGQSQPIPGLLWHDSKGGLYEAVIEHREDSLEEWVPVEVVHEEKS